MAEEKKVQGMTKTAVSAVGNVRGARMLIVLAVLLDPTFQGYVHDLVAAFGLQLPANILTPLLGVAGGIFWIARKFSSQKISKPNLKDIWSE